MSGFKSLNHKSGKPRDLRVIKFYLTLSFLLKQVLLISGYCLNVYHLHWCHFLWQYIHGRSNILLSGFPEIFGITFSYYWLIVGIFAPYLLWKRKNSVKMNYHTKQNVYKLDFVPLYLSPIPPPSPHTHTSN